MLVPWANGSAGVPTLKNRVFIENLNIAYPVRTLGNYACFSTTKDAVMNRRTFSPSMTASYIAARMASYQVTALMTAVVIAIATMALIPIADVRWPNIPMFLPVYQATTIVCYAIVAYLIYGYFRQTRLHALLYLWSGCVYTSAILLVQFFSFPSAFVSDVRLLGGAQTPSWLWFFWHLGSTGMLFGYAWSEWRQRGRITAAPLAAFAKCAAGTVAALAVSVLAVTLFHDTLPVVDVAGDFSRITRTGYAPLIQAIIVMALFMLWRATRFATPISAWLGVAIVALIFDNAITMAGGARLTVGWYIGRINALVSALVMLVLYLKEVNRVYLRAAAMASELARANERLATEHSRMLTLFEQAPGFMAVLAGPDHRVQITNAAFRRLIGERAVIGLPLAQALPELAEQGYVDLMDRVRGEEQPYVGTAMKLSLRGGIDTGHKDRFIDVLFQPNAGVDSASSTMFIQGHDVTEQQHARCEVERQQHHLEELVSERTRKLEDTQTALMHAQKLEAIGKMTGGVAHDFNNVLHIINGNIDLIKMFVPANEKVHGRCESAQTAIRRGATLSTQLLAFARKQPLQPDAVFLPEVFASIDLLLKRAVGERVEVDFVVGRGIWNVLVDPQQMENVILNLALNASDAMPAGGTLTIRVDNVHKDGDAFVHLAFTDTGHGMPDDVKARAFDPFFSTKGIGKGTGLGLSMAYGFVKQSGGHIDIDSTAGAGTTINILLPRTDGPATEKKTVAAVAVVGGTETVLAVDDELDILENVAAVLRDLGYRVLTASSPDAALALLDRQDSIDLLFTDVIMPGAMSATELAERARQAHPGMRVLFTSGYTENAVIHNGRLDEGINLLSKPYGRAALASALRAVLAAPCEVNKADAA